MYVCNAVSSCQRQLARWCERKSLTDLQTYMPCKAQCEATPNLLKTPPTDERKSALDRPNGIISPNLQYLQESYRFQLLQTTQ